MNIVPTDIQGAKQGAASFATSRIISIFAGALLGAFLVGGAGFSHIAAVHNAAHDYRHSMGFPCH
jgi:cobalt transporter subunit CbtB